ncbi:mobile mystery protein B [Paraburkholderia sp.]|uniref:mobile mystery protein B n=1 Tax=Paraburkholderia sp. TaxID=1926495 RepID=UPI003D6F2A01
MALDIAYGTGQTPLDPDERAGLKPRHISTQGQLDEWEAENILGAMRWLDTQRSRDVLNEDFCRELHRRMFGDTWKWAGQFRRSDKNIGCDWTQVPMRLRQLLGNAQYWLNENTFPVAEIATRFHHQIVSIHPFPNGNGRHSRQMADCLLKQCGLETFTWGSGRNLVADGETRRMYIAALQAADRGDIAPLVAFVRS